MKLEVKWLVWQQLLLLESVGNLQFKVEWFINFNRSKPKQHDLFYWSSVLAFYLPHRIQQFIFVCLFSYLRSRSVMNLPIGTSFMIHVLDFNFLQTWFDKQMQDSEFQNWLLDLMSKTFSTKSSISMVFCYQSCSDLLWEKIVLVIQKNFWNSRLKAENLQNFWDH